MAATLSRWCAAGTIEVQVCENPGSGVWETKPTSGHDWCHGERWHDEYHGKRIPAAALGQRSANRGLVSAAVMLNGDGRGLGAIMTVSEELAAEIREALAATDRGETVDLGSFAQYADDEDDG